jgi:hypothetical protein
MVWDECHWSLDDMDKIEKSTSRDLSKCMWVQDFLARVRTACLIHNENSASFHLSFAVKRRRAGTNGKAKVIGEIDKRPAAG